ncbi:MAG TPA: MoxR family ATPase [Solirubrobacter sp.]|nr:MoxR family ATPase [Solirubrobacter sp.]
MIADSILDEVEKAVVGKREPLELILMTILAGGHVLLEDVPGLGKTLAARAFATATGLHHARVQFIPDLLPSDLTGSAVLDAHNTLTFRRGPVFTNLLLADEINRASPKTQSALLEAMQEHQVTSDDHTRALPRPFHVLATQNPIEFEGTYPLPEAQLDRFLARVSFGYPSQEDEWEILQRHGATAAPELRAVIDREQLQALQRELDDIHVADPVGRYMVALVAATREHPSLELGASPRGSLALYKLARAAAALDDRDYVIPEDVKRVAEPALAHRVRLRPELWVRGVREGDVIAECVAQVPAPVRT